MDKTTCGHEPNIVCYDCFGAEHDPRTVHRCATCFTPIYEGLRCEKCEAEVLAARGDA